jgi:hypothetical protein
MTDYTYRDPEDGTIHTHTEREPYQLPYTLTKGVTAMRKGLVFESAIVRRIDGANHWDETVGLLNALQQIGKLQAYKNGTSGVVRWPDAAARLRYREGEPWCGLTEGDDYEWSMWCEIGLPNAHGREYALHRIAAILCDDANAFRMLHWCVENLGGEEKNQ